MNKTVTVFGKAHPLVGSIVIITCIIFGTIVVISAECLREAKELKKKKDFDILDNFQFSERLDEYSTNRNLFPQSHENYESNATN